jgi:rubrerythrin
MTGTTSELPNGTSLWDREVYAHLTEHVRNEREVLEAYVAAADATDSKALGYVVRLLIDDERRHHIMFQELADSLKHDAEFRHGDPAVPRLDFDRVDSAKVRDLTDQLVAREQADLRELKGLQKTIRDVKDTTLWSLLVDLMQRDTEKHIAMLRFVQKHSK